MPGLAWAGVATLAAPPLRLLLRRRLARGKELPDRLAERRGIDPTLRPPGRLVWLHAASVGETTSVLPVLQHFLDSAPDVSVLFTTGTVTAAALLAQRVTPEQKARVVHRFVPLDVPRWGARFLDHWRPNAAAFLESELWPNLLSAARRRGIPMLLLNARMSERSYRRWQRTPRFAAAVLSSFHAVRARSDGDAERLVRLGATRVSSLGDLKFAAPPLPADPALLDALRARLGDRPAWLAASTHPGEEALVFAVHRMLSAAHPDLLTIVAPRHPERGAELAAQAAALDNGAANLRVGRRSLSEPPPDRGIWIADTLGELGLWYRLAPITFVGRSLLPPGGGQNPLEPARLGCAIAVGPHTGNFTDHVALLREAQALEIVPDAPALARFVAAMLANPETRAAMGARAASAIARHSDLPARTAEALLSLLGPAG